MPAAKDQPWTAHVFHDSSEGSQSSTGTQFGAEIVDPTELETRVRQAQLAALNPQVDRDTFLTVDPSTYVETKDLSFTNTSVVVKVSGKGLPKLNFVIAPEVNAYNDDTHIGLIKNMIMKYTSSENSVALFLTSCHAIHENQKAGMIIQRDDISSNETRLTLAGSLIWSALYPGSQSLALKQENMSGSPFTEINATINEYIASIKETVDLSEKPRQESEMDFVEEFMKNSAELWEQLLDNEFCRKMADNTVSESGFKTYMVQDYLYLRECIGFKYGSHFKLEDQEGAGAQAAPSINKAIGYAEFQRETCLNLSIPDIEQTKSMKATARYMDFLTYGLVVGDYADFQVMQLPCLLVWHHISKEIVWRISYMVYFQGYHKIAHGLLTGGIPVNKTTVYYKLWIEPNSVTKAGTSAQKRQDITNKILNEHPGKKDQNTIARWNALFRYACLMEIEFFKQGLDTVVRIALSSSSSTSHVGERARGKQHAVIQNMMPSDPIPSL
ncbi:hypothetical protein CTheo_6280 [Ceratobasidium theobromae]|uniref:Thiaminase-2/PQQC domain-containing protein n=1 Tax=Ceratobasidium theobromae TaxID=1582974 RepID=A0A5N5QF88_9AGAM|nr:hypothetical protein CTheo_6280 [Ceratobasidium theobromae]